MLEEVPIQTAERPTEEDRQLIKSQLGRLRYEPEEVAARCYLGYPAVVKGFREPGPPRPDETLSTSLYWISCPWLERRIQGLENRDWLHHLRWLLLHPRATSLRERLGRVGADYTKCVRAAFDARRPEIFEERFGQAIMGVGGTADPLGLKCLHTHVAWTLAGGDSPVGELTLALVALDLELRGRDALDCGRDCRADPVSFGLRPPPALEV